MKSRFFAAVIAALISAALPNAAMRAQEEKDAPASRPDTARPKPPGVPFLSEIPIIGALFRRNRVLHYTTDGLPEGKLKAILILDGEKPVEMDENGRPNISGASFLDRFMGTEIKKRFPAVESAAVTKRLQQKEKILTAESQIEIIGPKDAVQAAADYAAAIVEASNETLTLEFKIVETPHSSAKAPGVRVTMLDMAGFERVVQKLHDEKGNVVSAPKITALMGQDATISVMNKIAFVKDFTIEEVGGKKIADPVIDHVFEGFEIGAAGLRLPGKDGIAFSVKTKISSVKRPFAEHKTQLTDGHEVTIQLPETRVGAWGSDDIVLHPDEVGFVIDGLSAVKGEAEEIDVMVLCRVREETKPAPFAAKVLLFDVAAKSALARIEQGSAPAIGAELSIGEGDSMSARGRVAEVHGDMIIIEMTSGATKKGDTVR